MNTLLKEISSSNTAQTLELFLSLIKLFLTVLDKLSWKEKDECIYQLSSYTKCWIENTYGNEPNEQAIEAELKVCYDIQGTLLALLLLYSVGVIYLRQHILTKYLCTNVGLNC